MAMVQQFDEHNVLTLGALALHDMVASNLKIDSARENGFRLTKSRFFINVRDKTIQQGPIMIGIALNTGTTALEATIENDPQSLNADMLRGKGVFIRGLLQAGRFQISVPGGEGQMNTGIEVSYGKNGWSVPEGQNAFMWAYNMGDATLTTGTVIDTFIEHFGVWLRD